MPTTPAVAAAAAVVRSAMMATLQPRIRTPNEMIFEVVGSLRDY
jgi:hypothetical protein